MEVFESPNASSESGTIGLSPSHSFHGPSRKRKFSHVAERPPREYGLMRDTGKHNSSRFVGSASGIHFIRGVYLRLARKSARDRRSSAPDGSLNDLVPGEDDQLRPGQTSRPDIGQELWRPHEVAADTETNETNETNQSAASFEDLVTWSKSYFESWHPILPFLSAPDVLALLEKMSNGSSSIGCLSHLDQSIVRSIMSISLADSRQSAPFGRPVPASLVFRTIEEAMSASQFALYQPASIHATQAALAIQLFLISMLKLNAASRLGGLIVRMAFHLGLHRCPSRFPFFSQQEAVVRRRVFWSIYCNERLLCQSLGLPLDIRDDDVDVCYPGEERHASPSAGTEDNRLHLLSCLAKHARIRGLILELRNKSVSSRDDTPDHESHVQAELARWSNEIHDLVEDDVSEMDGAPSDVGSFPPLSHAHRVFLLLLKFESMISLNRPMMASDPSSVAYRSGLQNCIFAAKSILILLKKHQTRYKLSSDADGALLTKPLLWPSVTWAIWISAFILLYAASEGQLSVSSALRHVEAGKSMLHHIAARDTAWPEFSLSAIGELAAAVRELSQPASLAGQAQRPPESSVGPPRSHHHSSLPNDSARPSSMSLQRQSTSTSATGKKATEFRHPRASFSPYSAASPGIPDEQGVDGPLSSMTNAGMPPTWHESLPEQRENGQGVSQSEAWRDRGPPHAVQARGTVSTSASPQGQATPLPVSQAAPQPGALGPGRTPSESFGASTMPAPPLTPGQMPADDQESMAWYDQLFANSLGAIDYPFLAAAQFDSTVDPTWSYLR